MLLAHMMTRYHGSMDLEIRHLRLVVAIAETGSVTRAGERLYLTQSALSHQLKDIESRLNTPLFHRVGKRMVPTAAGEQFSALFGSFSIGYFGYAAVVIMIALIAGVTALASRRTVNRTLETFE